MIYSATKVAHISFVLLSRTVKLVRHRESGQGFAMKVIKRQKMTKDLKVQLLVERDIFTFIHNPFIVSMFCSFETTTHLFTVMEYVEGKEAALDWSCVHVCLISRVYVVQL